MVGIAHINSQRFCHDGSIAVRYRNSVTQRTLKVIPFSGGTRLQFTGPYRILIQTESGGDTVTHDSNVVFIAFGIVGRHCSGNQQCRHHRYCHQQTDDPFLGFSHNMSPYFILCRVTQHIIKHFISLLLYTSKHSDATCAE